MAEHHSTIIEFPRGKYDPRKDETEYFYRRFRAPLRELVVLRQAALKRRYLL